MSEVEKLVTKWRNIAPGFARDLEAAIRKDREATSGMVLVPREPTEAMLCAAVRVWDSSPPEPEQISCARDTWRSMLTAATNTAVSDSGGLGRES